MHVDKLKLVTTFPLAVKPVLRVVKFSICIPHMNVIDCRVRAV